MEIDIGRVYDELPGGTYRILVDRMWPRGIKKSSPKVDVWLKDVAPSTDLRKWYGHEEAKAEQFARRYRAELADNDGAVEELRRIIAEHPHPLLVYAAKAHVSNASVLRDYLTGG